MSRNHNTRAKKAATTNVIDVDEFHKRYEDTTNDVVQCSSAQEFRKAWRSAHKEKGSERTSRSAESPCPSRQNRGQQQPSPCSSRAISTSTPGNVGVVVAAGGQHQNKQLQRVRQQLNKTEARRSMSQEEDKEDLPSTQRPRVQLSEKRANNNNTPTTTPCPSHSLRRRRFSPSTDTIDPPPLRRSKRPQSAVAGPSGTKRHRSITPPPPSTTTSQRPVSSRLRRSPDITIVSGYPNPNPTPATPTGSLYKGKGNIRPPSPDIMVLDDKRPPSPSVAVAVAAASVGESDVNKKRPRPLSGLRSGMSASASMMTDDCEKRKKVFVELFSEDDIVIPEPPAKRKKLSTTPNRPIPQSHSPIEFSSDSDDDWDHPGLCLNDPNVWLPTPTNANRLEMPELPENNEDSVSQRIDQLSLIPTSPPPPPRQRWRTHPDTSRWLSTPPATSSEVYVWDKLRMAQNVHFRPRSRPIIMEFSRKTITRPKDVDFNMHRLKVAHSVKQAPGTINVIEQRGVHMVLGSACAGGLADVPDETRDPYNRSGSLTAWTDGPEILDAHKSTKNRGQWIKYYTVNDVKFNPISDSFASTGQDKKLRIWTLPKDPESDNVRWKVDLNYDYYSVPHNLAFRPGSEILAVAEKQVFLYDLTDDTVREYRFQMHDRLSPHVIGSMAWGSGLTADHLFVSSEPTKKTFTGAHKVYDLGAQKEAYGFVDAKEAGDSLAVDPTGSMLALCTQAEPGRHVLRLYDVQRRHSNAIISLDIVPFRTRWDDFEGEVNVATFSPDGLYLALSRNDNRTHVYDRRMLSKRREAASTPLFDFAHTGESKMASVSEAYGVVNAEWVQSEWTRRACLVTGGEDGCVRMWDPAMAVDDDENGKVLAEVNYDVSQFSIGDPFAEEHRLVVGDASGEITIFDNIIV